MSLAPARGTRAWTNLRAAWQAKIDTLDGWTCRRCSRRIPPNDPNAWHLGHPDDMTNGPTLTADLEPEHPRCNTSAGATAGNLARNKPLPPSRNWT